MLLTECLCPTEIHMLTPNPQCDDRAWGSGVPLEVRTMLETNREEEWECREWCVQSEA